MKSWPLVPLKSVATIERSAVDPRRLSEGIQYVGLENIPSGGGRVRPVPLKNGAVASAKFRFGPEHVLFGKLRPYLAKIATADFVGICSTDILPIRPGPDVDREYLRHYLLQPSVVARAASLATGANLPRLSPASLESFLIPLPSLPEQRRITTILSHAEALCRKRRQILDQLDGLTQSIFLDMFDDPVTNPRGWPNPTLGKLLTFQQYGPRFYNEAYSAEGVRIVRITDLNEAGDLDFSAMPRLVVTPEEHEKFALHAGDLIFARTGATVGKVGLIRPSDPVCIAGAYFITMRFDETVEPVYVRAVLTSPSIRAVVTKQSRQAAQQNFSGPALRRLPMPVPPLDLQRRFVRNANTIDALRATHRTSLAQLKALFSSLQHRAFRGEL